MNIINKKYKNKCSPTSGWSRFASTQTAHPSVGNNKANIFWRIYA